MKFSLSQSVFFLIFFPVFFLLLIFGETPFGIFLLGTIAALLLFFSPYLSFTTLEKVPRYLISIFTVLIGVAVLSLLTTLSVPLSINKLVFLVFSGVCFVFFAAVKKEWLTDEMFCYGAVLIGCVLSVMTVIFLFFPQLVRFLPSLNLLTANYGHNHASVYFLFSLPLSFFLWKEKKVWWQSLPCLVIMVGLFLSFGRVAIVLAIFEILFLFLSAPQKVPKWFQWFLLPFAGILIFLSTLSAFPQLSDSEHCVMPVFQTQFCKPLVNETRAAYWSQALRATAQRPVLGWGGGSSTLISRRFYRHAGEFSSYVHNEYLQFVVEYGVVGGVVLLLFFIPVVKRCTRALRAPSHSFVYFMSIAALTLCLDAFFDYNWNYVGIWTIFLVSLAMLFRHHETTTSKKNLSASTASLSPSIIKWLWVGGSISMLLWSGLYFTHLIARTQKKYEFSQRIFPFVYWEAEEDMRNPDVSMATKTFMFHLYREHHNVITAYIAVLPLEQDKRAIYKQLLKLEPLNFSTWKRLLNEDIVQMDITAVVNDLKWLNATFSGTQKYLVSDTDKKSFFDLFISSLNTYLSASPNQVAEAYVESYHFYLFLPRETTFELLQYPQRYSSETVQWVLSQVPEKDLWKYSESLYEWRLQRLRAAMKDANYDELEKILQEVSMNTTWEYPKTLETVFEAYHSAIEQFRQTRQKEQAVRVISSWANISQLQSTSGKQIYQNLAFNSQVAGQAIVLGEESVAQEPEQAAQLYILAQQIFPSSFSDYPVLPQSTGIHASPSEVLFIQTLLKKPAAQELLQQYPFLKLLQRVANTLLTQQRDTEALEVLRVMNRLYISDSIAPAQLGNYYYLRGNELQAKQELQACITAQRNLGVTQSSCYEGLVAIEKMWNDGSRRYWETGQLILDQK